VTGEIYDLMQKERIARRKKNVAGSEVVDI
jgi:hypothetical protein